MWLLQHVLGTPQQAALQLFLEEFGLWLFLSLWLASLYLFEVTEANNSSTGLFLLLVEASFPWYSAGKRERIIPWDPPNSREKRPLRSNGWIFDWFRNEAQTPFVRESKTVLDSEFQAVDSGFQELDFSFCHWNLDCGFQSLVGLRIP